MTGRINPTTFDRYLVERKLTVRRFSEVSGISRDTIAKIRRGDEVSVETIETVAATFRGIAIVPLVPELLAS